MTQRINEPGQRVIFVDEVMVRHEALVTEWHGETRELEAGEHHPATTSEPAVNLLIVSTDEQKRDQYGRQIERSSSIVHRSSQGAHGNYWMWPDEEK